MLIELTQRVSHRLWRQIVKRERRRRVRQRRAQELHLKQEQKQRALMQDPHYVKELERLQQMEEETQRLEEEEAKRRKEEWLLRDAALHSKFLYEKRKKQLQEEQQKKQEELIKKEWEEKQRTEEEKKKEEQEALLKAATESLGKPGEEPTHNPEPPPGYSRSRISPPKREPCPFFTKTGACRFGVQCSREHVYPERSHTILLPNMYSHFGMDHLAMEEKDSDILLEYSESEMYQLFREFFEDVLPEFQRCGKVVQFKVCANVSPHLRGNVYVQFMNEDDALKACALFNGRWYAGRQMTCYQVTIEKWRYALCGLYWRKQCPKGDHCNFLHAYRNPGNVFWQADRDMQPFSSLRKTPLHHRLSPERNFRKKHEKSSKLSNERRRNFKDDEDSECEIGVSQRSKDLSDTSETEVNESSKRKHSSQGSRQKLRRSRSEKSSDRSEQTSSKSRKSSRRSERSSSRSEQSSSRSERSSSRSERFSSKSERYGSRSDRSSSRSDRCSKSEWSRSKSARLSSSPERPSRKSSSKILKKKKKGQNHIG
ncbi:U2 small nuclear ribonucleoprotein auxiliary factor 35 kDa subunit-related protein 2-like [Eriocheir sinensis]|uniref:U2 small nuclear ribonucleoprotein auxiliary factor 35 kDa subunit-related protein 2-like n=1 Tax=Eriocheir sinensis TaxID=95602 RepID=UPI0021C7F3FD|nr:U2 small nuclear ribonucleoprotein auxiliary factor 35 kDa subunit-related protein 2-like [Eriocheir sinensis]